MKRLDFLRSLLGIPLIAAIPATVPGKLPKREVTTSSLPYVVEDSIPIFPTGTYGEDGKMFCLTFNEPAFQPRDLITYDREVGELLLIVSGPMKAVNADRYLYRVKIASETGKGMSGKWLSPGVVYIKISNAVGDYITPVSKRMDFTDPAFKL